MRLKLLLWWVFNSHKRDKNNKLAVIKNFIHVVDADLHLPSVSIHILCDAIQSNSMGSHTCQVQ